MTHELLDPQQHNFGHPQRIALERVILGSLLIDYTKVHIAQSNIQPDDFFKIEHRITFEIILDIYSQKQDVDIISVWHEIQARDLEDKIPIKELLQMSDAISATTHFDTHCQLLREWGLRSALWHLCIETIQKINTNEHRITDLIDNAQLQIGQMTGRIQHHNTSDTANIINEMWSEIRAGRGNGIPITDIEPLNDLVGGARPGDLIVIAGRPGSGKSVTTSNIIRKCIQDQRGAMLWSLEMDKIYIAERIIAMMAKVDHARITNPNATFTQAEDLRISKAEHAIKEANIHLVERPGISALEIRSEIIFQNATGAQIDTLIIDHGGLLRHINPDDHNTVEQIGNTTKLLKQTAQELKIKIVLLWQLNRQAGKGVTPSLSDLRGSGRIEEDADKVLFVHRPELYSNCPLTIEHKGNDIPTANLVQFIMAKNRRGPVGREIGYFHRDQYRFTAHNGADDKTYPF